MLRNTLMMLAVTGVASITINGNKKKNKKNRKNKQNKNKNKKMDKDADIDEIGTPEQGFIPEISCKNALSVDFNGEKTSCQEVCEKGHVLMPESTASEKQIAETSVWMCDQHDLVGACLLKGYKAADEIADVENNDEMDEFLEKLSTAASAMCMCPQVQVHIRQAFENHTVSGWTNPGKCASVQQCQSFGKLHSAATDEAESEKACTVQEFSKSWDIEDWNRPWGPLETWQCIGMMPNKIVGDEDLGAKKLEYANLMCDCPEKDKALDKSGVWDAGCQQLYQYQCSDAATRAKMPEKDQAKCGDIKVAQP